MMLSFGKNGTIYVMEVLGKFRRAEKKTRRIVIIDCDGDVGEARKGFESWLRGFRSISSWRIRRGELEPTRIFPENARNILPEVYLLSYMLVTFCLEHGKVTAELNFVR